MKMLLKGLTIMMLLLFARENVRSATCPSSVTTAFSASTQLDSFTGYSSSQIQNAEVGSVSGALYLMYSLSSPPTATAFVKLNQDGSLVWSKSVNFKTLTKSLAVDSAEHNVYFIQFSSSPPMIVARLSAADGTLTDSQSQIRLVHTYNSLESNFEYSPNIVSSYDHTRVHVLSDNSGYYVIMQYTSDSPPHVMKYLFSSPASNQNYSLVGTNIQLLGSLKITDTEFLCISYTSGSILDALFVKFTFARASADWTNKMVFSSNNANFDHSESLLSADKSKIYSLLSYLYSPPSNYIYLTIFKTSDGTIIGNRYRSNSGCFGVYGFILSGDYIIASLYSLGQYYLMFYNIPLDSFTYRSFTGSSLYDLAIEAGSGRILAFGSKSSKGYVAKFPLNSLSLMTDFTSTSSISMSIFTVSNSNHAVTSAPYSATVSNYTNSVTVSDAAYISTIQYIPDYYFQTINQNYSLLESTSKSITPNITCTFSGLTSITYSIINYINPAPSWITINPTSGQLSIASPSVASDTTYSFYIKSSVSGVTSPVQIIMSVTVQNCAVDFCTTCSSSATICAICNTGYNVSTTGACSIQSNSTSASTNSGSAQETSGSAKTQAIIILSVISLSAIIVSISGLASTSSLSSIWSMFNQIQILCLLLLSKADLPKDVKTVIAGFKLFSNPSLSIPFQEMPFYQSAFWEFNSSCSNPDFETFGLKSDSSVPNTASFFIFFVVLIVLHILVILLKKCIEYCCTRNNCRCPRKNFQWITDKCLAIMTYGYYIRFVMQMNQFLLVVSIYEVYSLNLSNIFNIVSFIFALLVLLFCLCYTGVVLYLSFSPYKLNDKGRNKIGEFFMGIKMENKYKFFITVLILRRTLFIVLLINLMSISSRFLVVILSFIQLTYLLYVIFIRPYIEAKGNIIEIINEIYFFLLLSFLIFWNRESEWTPLLTSIYCYLITSNSIVIFIIVIIDAIKLCIVRFCSKAKISPKMNQTIAPNEIHDREVKSEIMNEEKKEMNENDQSEVRFKKAKL